MNHFMGITPEERYKNEMLEEARKTNELLEKLVDLFNLSKHEKQKSKYKKAVKEVEESK